MSERCETHCALMENLDHIRAAFCYLVEKAGATMQEVVSSVRKVTEIVTDISLASQEQSSGIQEVSSAIGQIDGMTQRNTALVEEASSAAQELKQQAHHLSLAVGQFKLSASHTSVSHLPAKSVAHSADKSRRGLRLVNG